MSEVNIFDKISMDRPKWAKLAHIGDSIQGTYVDRHGSIDGYGHKQIVYVIKTKDGLTNVAFRENKFDVHNDMKTAKLGQIVGFKYLSDATIKNKLGQKVNIKIYRAAHDPTDTSTFDQEWIKEKGGTLVEPPVVTYPEQTTESTSTAPEVAAPTRNIAPGVGIDKDFEGFSNFGAKSDAPVPVVDEVVLTPTAKMVVIERLAKEKLGVTDKTLVKEKVMEATDIVFKADNYDRIIEALKTI